MSRIKVTKTTEYFLIDKEKETETAYYTPENITDDFFSIQHATKNWLLFTNEDFERGKDDINNYSCLGKVVYQKKEEHALEYTLYMYANRTNELDFTEHYLIEIVSDDSDFIDGDTWFKYHYRYIINYKGQYTYTVESDKETVKEDMLYNQYKVSDITVYDQYSWLYKCEDDCDFIESIHADLMTDDIKNVTNLFADEYEALIPNIFGNN